MTAQFDPVCATAWISVLAISFGFWGLLLWGLG